MKIKVRFNKVWDSNGTCYRKGLSIDEKTFNTLYDMIQAEIAREKDYYRAFWLNTPIKKTKQVRFLNLTQAKFIINKLLKAPDVDIISKRALADYNTYLVIA